MTIAIEIPSVNYHLWKPCNMKCGFCFATFDDIAQDLLPKGHLGREDSMSVVHALAEEGFRKINFAGGEPTLCPWLPDLIVLAKDMGFTTSIVTNGSRITQEWLDSVSRSLDWVALSIDSLNPNTLEQTGRTTSSGPMSEQDYLRVTNLIKQNGIRLKINTVVGRYNLREDLRDFIIDVRPERWKLLQVLPIEGQNHITDKDYLISRDEFELYVRLYEHMEDFGITVVAESNELMTGSYVMVDPAGRFFDNVLGMHAYSRPILEVGVEEALKDVTVDDIKFLDRGGLYDW